MDAQCNIEKDRKSCFLLIIFIFVHMLRLSGKLKHHKLTKHSHSYHLFIL